MAVRYCLMIVGEAVNWVSDDVVAHEPSIPWRRIIALRHRLAHGYWLLDQDILAEIVRTEVEPLVGALDRICGLSTAGAVDAALDAGADFVGIVFLPPTVAR
jgi:uncharacterized protein with HEPN domain